MMIEGEDISPCGAYRYRLWRTWNVRDKPNIAVYIIRNPPAAGPGGNTPSLMRFMRLASKHGFTGIDVVSLHAGRADTATDLFAMDDPIGPLYNAYFNSVVKNPGVGRIIAVWGRGGGAGERAGIIKSRLSLAGHQLWCFGKTKWGYPKELRTVSRAAKMIPFT